MNDPVEILVTTIILGMATHAAISIYWRAPVGKWADDWRDPETGFKPFNCNSCAPLWVGALIVAIHSSATAGSGAWAFIFWLTSWFQVRVLDAYLPTNANSYPLTIGQVQVETEESEPTDIDEPDRDDLARSVPESAGPLSGPERPGAGTGLREPAAGKPVPTVIHPQTVAGAGQPKDPCL